MCLWTETGTQDERNASEESADFSARSRNDRKDKKQPRSCNSPAASRGADRKLKRKHTGNATRIPV